jgi:hypothetical protein
MAPLFSAIGSGKVEKFFGRVTGTKQANGNFSEYTDVSVSVNTAAKRDGEQYAPSIFISALTTDDSIEKGDKVVIEGILTSREYNGKTYYQLSPFQLFPIVVLEKAKDGAATTTKTATKSAAPAVEDDEDF